MDASSDPSLEERPKQFVQDCIINLILMQLIIPIKMFTAALILRKKCTQADGKAICTSTIVLCVMMGIATMTTMEEFMSYITGSEVSGLLFAIVAAVVQVVMYKISKFMFYRICKLPVSSKK